MIGKERLFEQTKHMTTKVRRFVDACSFAVLCGRVTAQNWRDEVQGRFLFVLIGGIRLRAARFEGEGGGSKNARNELERWRKRKTNFKGTPFCHSW